MMIIYQGIMHQLINVNQRDFKTSKSHLDMKMTPCYLIHMLLEYMKSDSFQEFAFFLPFFHF